ncbi:MAG: hypothetical protein ACREPH_04085 [Rhodanobacteraceae bacterium]
MNKRLLCTALLVLCGGVALALPAFAQTPQDPQDSNAQPTTASNQKPAAAGKHETKRAVPPLNSRMCIRDTGSHIPPPKGQCLPVAGNSYNQQDIKRTGATNIGQALQMLDPSVTVHGH